MDNETALKASYEAFRGEFQENIAWLYFHRNFLLRTTDLENRDRVLDDLERLGRNPKVRALIIVGSPESKGRQEFLDFFAGNRAAGMRMLFVHRMYNVISQIVVRIMELEKYVVYVNSGFVISPYLNMGLACDFRILANDAIIQNPCLEMGMAPKGGGGFFLPRLLGRRLAYEIMLSDRDIPAVQAKTMGLIDEVAPFETLEAVALAQAQIYAAKPPEAVAAVKKMINFNYKDLPTYMAHENEVLMQILRRNDLYEQKVV